MKELKKYQRVNANRVHGLIDEERIMKNLKDDYFYIILDPIQIYNEKGMVRNKEDMDPEKQYFAAPNLKYGQEHMVIFHSLYVMEALNNLLKDGEDPLIAKINYDQVVSLIKGYDLKEIYLDDLIVLNADLFVSDHENAQKSVPVMKFPAYYSNDDWKQQRAALNCLMEFPLGFSGMNVMKLFDVLIRKHKDIFVVSKEAKNNAIENIIGPEDNSVAIFLTEKLAKRYNRYYKDTFINRLTLEEWDTIRETFENRDLDNIYVDFNADRLDNLTFSKNLNWTKER